MKGIIPQGKPATLALLVNQKIVHFFKIKHQLNKLSALTFREFEIDFKIGYLEIHVPKTNL